MPNPGPVSNIFTNSMLVVNNVSAPARTIFPIGNLTAVTAPGNGTMSFQYLPISDPMTATRMDVLLGISQASSATTNTFGWGISAYGGIYTNVFSVSGTGSTQILSALTTGSTAVSYTVASNTAGQTQLNQAAVRGLSVPMNAVMLPGEYFAAFAWSTNTISAGLSTTALGQTVSIYGGNQIQTASNFALDFTNATTATGGGLYAGMGIHSVSQAAALSTYAVSDILGTGANLSAANIALVFRNS
jgi:hypothetical protein